MKGQKVPNAEKPSTFSGVKNTGPEKYRGKITGLHATVPGVVDIKNLKAETK